MPSLRIAAADQVAMAVDDLVGLGSHATDLAVRASGTGSVTIRVGGDEWSATVVPVDSAGFTDARRLTAANKVPGVVVGNKLSEEARTHLTNAGWSWFDRRVGVHLVHDSRVLDLRFVAGDTPHEGPAMPLAGPRSDGPIRGRAGISYAAALLLEPAGPPTMRAVAREIDMSPTAVSNAARLLTDAGLVDADGTPARPDLFWALAEVWRPVKVVGVAAVPDPKNAENYVLGGDQAALELGAPVFTTDERPWLWVPTQTDARRAQRTLGAAEWTDRNAAIAVPPTPLVVTRRVDGKHWPLAHPVFVALDLARDPGRGREILDQWEPEEVARVWE